jgi:hypothetical protein
MLAYFACVLRINQPRRNAAPPSPAIATYATGSFITQLEALCTYDASVCVDIPHATSAVESLIAAYDRARDFVEEQFLPAASRLRYSADDCELIDAMGIQIALTTASMQNVSSLSHQVGNNVAIAALALRKIARAAKDTVATDANTKTPFRRPKDPVLLAAHRLHARTLQSHEATLDSLERELRTRRAAGHAFEQWLDDHRKLIAIWKGQTPGRCLAAGAKLFQDAVQNATRSALVPWV